MNFKTTYYKLGEILGQLTEQLNNSTPITEMITKFLNEGVMNTSDWKDFSVEFATDDIYSIFSDGRDLWVKVNDGEPIAAVNGNENENRDDPPLALPEEVLMKPLIGDTTLLDIFNQQASQCGSLNIQFEAVREVLNGNFSSANLSSYVMAIGGNVSPTLYNIVASIVEQVSSDSAISPSTMLSWFSSQYSSAVPAEVGGKLEWTTTEYTTKEVFGVTISDVLNAVGSVLVAVGGLIAKIVGIVATVVGNIVNYFTQVVNENVNTTATVNEAACINAFNLRLGRWEGTMTAFENYLYTALGYFEPLRVSLITTGFATISDDLISGYCWIDHYNGTEPIVRMEIFPSACAMTDEGFNFFGHVTLNQYFSWVEEGYGTGKLSVLMNNSDYAALKRQALSEASWFIDPAVATDAQLRNGLAFVLLMLTLGGVVTQPGTLEFSHNFATLESANWTQIQSTDPLNTQLEIAAATLIYGSINWDASSSFFSWTKLKDYAGLSDNQSVNSNFYRILPIGALSKYTADNSYMRVILFGRSINGETYSFVPFIFSKGNFAILTPEYSSNWKSNTIWALVGLAVAAAVVVTTVLVAKRAIQKSITRTQATAQQRLAAFERDPSQANFNSYFRAHRRATRVSALTGSAGLGYYPTSVQDDLAISSQLSRVMKLIGSDSLL